MGIIKAHHPVKLIIGLIFQQENILKKTEIILKHKFKGIDFKSQIMPFTNTIYYENEFGKNLKRIFLSFDKLITLEDIHNIKIYTNKLEKKLSSQNKRQINIDPGYVDVSKLILLSTKDYSHRIYLRKGIYAEVTLYFKDKTFNPWPWTYPDYITGTCINIFNSIRGIYIKQLRSFK